MAGPRHCGSSFFTVTLPTNTRTNALSCELDVESARWTGASLTQTIRDEPCDSCDEAPRWVGKLTAQQFAQKVPPITGVDVEVSLLVQRQLLGPQCSTLLDDCVRVRASCWALVKVCVT